MEFRILGPLEAVGQDGPVALPRGRGRSLLALLTLRAGQVVATDRLVDELWGGCPPPTATTALHGLVSDLRRRLEPDRAGQRLPGVLQTRPPGYLLAIDPGQVDANRFRQLVDLARGLSPPERAERLRTALGLWRGPALAEFTYEPFAQAAITALSDLRLTALEERVEADLSCGRHAALVAELEGLVAEHPLRERLCAQLIVALYRCGRQADALAAYGATRRRLVDELGIEPGPQLRQLEAAVLRHDPALAPPATAQPVEASPNGAPGEAAPWLRESRKTVTVIFIDLAASAVADTTDPETHQRALRAAAEAAAETLIRHGGTVEGVIGNVVVAVFGTPVAHEDDALRAVRAAIEVRAAVGAANEAHGAGVAARVGMNTGEVIVGDPARSATQASGATVTHAARLQQAAEDGQILIGEATRRLVDGAVVVEPVAGGSTAGLGWRLMELRPESSKRGPRLDTPMIGREPELIRLRETFDRIVRQDRAEIVVIVGEAGVGKSRLAVELASELQGRARIVTGGCPSYGEGLTFWPLREILEQAAVGGSQPAAAEVADALGVGDGPPKATELFPAVRGLLESLARHETAVVIIDDMHWAQPTLLDLVDYLGKSVRAPALLVCLGRPELLEHRSTWTPQRARMTLLTLEPLDPSDASALVAKRLAGRMLPAETVTQIVAIAQGNPLYVEQLVAAVREHQDLTLPVSLQALLAARLDRLGPAERDVLRCASVVGVEFPEDALAALVPEAARRFLGRHLQTLQEKELIGTAGPSALRRATWSFRHVLIQRAAYRSLTRQDRAALHEDVARWLDTGAGGTFADFAALAGYHLEQAYSHRRDLGRDDGHTHALAVRAGAFLASAGARAFARFDVAGAENFCSRARVLLPVDHPQREAVHRQLVEAYQVLGRHADSDAVLADMVAAGNDPVRDHVIALERARIRLFTECAPLGVDAIRARATRALHFFEHAGDHAGAALACFVLGYVHLWQGQPRQMEAVSRDGLRHAQRSGEPREQAAAHYNLALALVSGETPVHICLPECERLVPWLGMEHPLVLGEVARLRAMLGQFDRARSLVASARQVMAERIRARRPEMFLAGMSAEVELLAGALPAAESELRIGAEMARNMGEQEALSMFAADLARVLAVHGAEEAERFARLSLEAAPVESVLAQARSRAAMVRALAVRGRHREAVDLARQAVHQAPTPMLNLRADVHLALAEALHALGEPDSAVVAARAAAALYDRKGNRVGAAKARSTAAGDRRSPHPSTTTATG